ncbi:MAG: hypothetical protein GYB64_16170 [Chloroflexi bacterium]|nr:hypothetical protein [Chloroflexota bacterium]
MTALVEPPGLRDQCGSVASTAPPDRVFWGKEPEKLSMFKRILFAALMLSAAALACTAGTGPATPLPPTNTAGPTAVSTIAVTDEATITPSTTPTAEPTTVPTVAPTTPPIPAGGPAEPITFAAGADRAFVEDDLAQGEVDIYAVRALEGQQAAVILRSPETGLTFSTAGVSLPAVQRTRWWRGQISANGDLFIEVQSAEGFSGPYRLDVVILPVGVEGFPQLEDRCTMAVAPEADILYTPSPQSDVFAEGDVVGAQQLEVAAVTPDGGYYGFEPGVAQAARTGANRLRWVAADGVSLAGLCTWVDEITLEEVEADIAFDQLPICQIAFVEGQIFRDQPAAQVAPLGVFEPGESTLAYALTDGGNFLGVVPPLPRFGRYGLDRLVWISTAEGQRSTEDTCADLQAVDYP